MAIRSEFIYRQRGNQNNFLSSYIDRGGIRISLQYLSIMSKKIENPMLFLKVSIMSITLGTIYTMGRKYQNIQISQDLSGQMVYFRQPLFQTWSLFFGMSFCFVFFKLEEKWRGPTKQLRKCPALLMAVPSFCDVFATILDSIGLIYTHVSVHQMLKGFIVVFTFLVSIFYLKRDFKRLHYVGVLLIFLGCLQIGRSNLDQYSSISAPNPLLGNSLCICGQFLLAFMFIYEEIILTKYDISVMEMVGYEGLWGVLLSSSLLLLTHSHPLPFLGLHDDYFDAFHQLRSSPNLMIGAVITLSSIGPFNYFGSKLIQISSACHRCNICSLRMISVWALSIMVGWESFRFVQLYGYVVLMTGSLVYNEAFDLEPTLIKLERFLLQRVLRREYKSLSGEARMEENIDTRLVDEAKEHVE